MRTTGLIAGIFISAPADIYDKRHALFIEQGHICGFRLRTRRITGAETISTMDSVILCWNATMTLPSNPEDGQIYFIKQMNNGAVTVKVGATGHYINDGRTNKKPRGAGTKELLSCLFGTQPIRHGRPDIRIAIKTYNYETD